MWDRPHKLELNLALPPLGDMTFVDCHYLSFVWCKQPFPTQNKVNRFLSHGAEPAILVGCLCWLGWPCIYSTQKGTTHYHHWKSVWAQTCDPVCSGGQGFIFPQT